MRRAVLVWLTLAVLFSFSACSQGEDKTIKPEDILFTFQCQATVNNNGKQTECDVSRSAPGVISVKITSGDANGMTYFWKDNKFSISYSGLTAESEDCVLPKTSFAYLIKQTLDSASYSGALTASHGNEFSGSSFGYDYTISVDGETGRIRKLNIPKYGLVVELHHYRELGI
ncbi:MAG: hypothetical protein E7518_05605 [Ruminococcaceae bacterium]|nr:hypothetical protein [Oscillospiraceae bacterium]